MGGYASYVFWLEKKGWQSIQPSILECWGFIFFVSEPIIISNLCEANFLYFFIEI